MKSLTKFEISLLAAFATAVLVVLGLAATTWKVAKDAAEAAQLVTRTHEVLDGLAHTRSDTLQIEFSTQNFRISGISHHLVDRDAAIATRERSLDQLKELTRDDPRQQARWMQLREVVDQRLGISRRVEELRKTQGEATASAFAAISPLQETRQRTYRLLSEMERQETQLLESRMAELLHTRRVMLSTGAIVALLMLGLLGATYLLIRHQLKQNEASRYALSQSEASLSATLLSIGDAVLATDTQGNITRMNRVAEFLTGWTLTEGLGRHVNEVLHLVNEHTRAPAVDPVEEVLRSGEIRGLANHTLLIALDGIERPIADSAAPIRDRSGQLSGVVLVFRDVSAEHKAEMTAREQNEFLEQRVLERTRQLSESEERYRTAFQTSADAFSITKLDDGCYLDINDGFLRLFGWSREEVLGRTSRDIGIWRRLEDRLSLIQVIRRDGYCENFEAEFVTKEGKVVTALVSANTIRLGDDKCMLAVTHDITARKISEVQIHALAFSDPLTGLPNRRLLMDRLEQALVATSRHGHQDALLFVDMDDFKTINDTQGHDKGDLLLKQVSQRLIASVREGDTVARLSGDEFVVLLQNLSSSTPEASAQAQVVAQKILSALAQLYDLDGHGQHSSASIGFTLFGGKQREKVEEPMKRAELAMYKAKTTGRGTMRIFEPEMHTAVATRATLEEELRQAVSEGHLLLYYQPQGGDDTRLNGAEALVRWRHRQRGLVSPAEFIPVAEASGLILPLGQWVLRTACTQLAQWASRAEMAHLTLAVNVSARQLRQSDFVEQVLSTLQESGANPARLKLELTESLLVDNVEDTIVKMNTLKASGVGFSLDDFGTGYSSLSYLKRLPLDQLKIDRSFVKDILDDPNDASIAKMVIALAESMNLSVIAEGVETEAQRVFLASLNCHRYQGYLFSRPLPLAEFEVFAQRAWGISL